jgi:lipopolysaccharide/colanic/teichoic acid biosynthesis glycosyltransferase
MDHEHLAVLLPETSAQGAERPAADICRTMRSHEIVPSYSIVTYPSSPPYDDVTDVFPHTGIGASPRFRSKPHDRQPSLPLQPNVREFTSKTIPLWKRLIDIVLASSGILIISPLLLLIALYIRIVSGGPVFFKQLRVGYKGRTFLCWKFRTMEKDAAATVHQNYYSDLINSDKPMKKLDDVDPRIIPLGKFFRDSGLDELPQLINVICGDMSLIGPRPCIPYEARQYLTWQLRRFDTLPGITGLWQVNGKNRTTFNEMMRYDINYIKNISVWTDLKILFKTPGAVISQLLGKKEHIKDLENIGLSF